VSLFNPSCWKLSCSETLVTTTQYGVTTVAHRHGSFSSVQSATAKPAQGPPSSGRKQEDVTVAIHLHDRPPLPPYVFKTYNFIKQMGSFILSCLAIKYCDNNNAPDEERVFRHVNNKSASDICSVSMEGFIGGLFLKGVNP
jgi:hypothetical protein